MLSAMPLDPIVPASALTSLRELVLVDCRPDESAYRTGHAPGARHAQLERDLSAAAPDAARGGRHPLPDARDFARKLAAWGITPSSHVVAYDDQNGANAAARLWWMLRALGHERVQVLDAGVPALLAAGYEFTTDVVEPIARPAYPVAAYSLPLADMEEVERARTAADRRVIDVRAAFRYRGEREPIDPIAGHIPGARNIPLTDNLKPDGTFKDAAELRALYERALDGAGPAQTIVHCGSGVTACHTLLALSRAGLPGAKLYVGSWSEWCRNPQRPREPA
jgi:thiosulfate/3-mercaptopyruvate sulfurtransferase